MKTRIVYWLAVQPTPYNKFLYDNLKKSERFKFQIFYSSKVVKNLPFNIKLSLAEDIFISKNLFIDFNMIIKSLDPGKFIVSVGWENINKLIIIFIRSLLGLPFGIWTDSINPQKYKNRNLINLVKKYILRSASFVLTTGEFGRRKMLETDFFKDTGKIISLPFFVPLTDKTKDKFQTSSKQIKLLLLARLVKRKGLDIAIKAIRELVNNGYDVQLFIGGVGELEQSLKTLAIDYNLEKNVKFLGWLDSNSLNHWRNNCDFLLHPVPEHDPYPLVVLESLAFGLPVIGTNLAGSVVDRVIDGYNGYIIEPGSISGIYTVIEKIIIESPDLKKLSINARKSAEKWPVSIGVSIVENAICDLYDIPFLIELKQ